MCNQLKAFANPIHHCSFRLSVLGGMAIVAALQCTPLLAEDLEQVAYSNTAGTPQAGISWMSGGIGDDARDAMRKAAVAYNVHVVFSDRHGSYLANIPFAVTRQDGRKLYDGISQGPLLYLKLAPGSYQIAAEIDRVWQNKRIQVGASNRSAKMLFVSRGE